MTLSERVWADAMADPAFVSAMEQGMADFREGRVAPFRHRFDREGNPVTDERDPEPTTAPPLEDEPEPPKNDPVPEEDQP